MMSAVCMKSRCLLLMLSVMLLSSVAQAAPSSFAYGPNGSWVIVWEHRGQWGYRGERVPRELASTIEEMAKNQQILGVAMNEHAWIVVGSKEWNGNNLPADLTDYMAARRREGYQVIDVALTRNNHWVLLYRRGDQYRARWSGGDAPEELIQYIRQVASRNGRVLGVGISMEGGWSVAYQEGNRIGYQMSSVPSDAVRYTDELYR